MKIRGAEKDITRIQCRLNSINVISDYCTDIERAPYLEHSYDKDVATITFSDSREIDSLIKMLEDFRDRSGEYISIWK